MDVFNSSDNVEQSSDDNSSKSKEHCSDKNVDPACDITREDLSNVSSSAVKSKEQCSDKNVDQSCDITREDLSNVSSSAVVEEEDTVLGEDESAKEFDVNFDEDELLKDTDTDDGKIANTESTQSETNIANFENSEENSLDTNQNLPISNAPDLLENVIKEPVIDSAVNNEKNCDNASTVNSTVSDVSVENKETDETNLLEEDTNDVNLEDTDSNVNLENTNLNEGTLEDRGSNEIHLEFNDSNEVNLANPNSNEEILVGKDSNEVNMKNTNSSEGILEDKDSNELNLELTTKRTFNEDATDLEVISSNVEESELKVSNKCNDKLHDSSNVTLTLNSKLTESDTHEVVSSSSKLRILDCEVEGESVDVTKSNLNDSVSSNTENQKVVNSSDCGENKVNEEFINSHENKSCETSVESKNENKPGKSSGKELGEEANSSDGTKFLHIDQDRNEESFETNDAGGEDPFAQTCDELMETQSSVNDTKLEKSGSQGDIPKTVNEMSSDFSTQMMDIQENSIESAQETSTNTAIQCNVDERTDNSFNDENSSKSQTGETEVDCQKDSSSINIENTDENNTEVKKNENTTSVAEKYPKQSEVSSQKEPSKVLLILPKPKTVNSATKSRSRGRKSSSEEDSDYSDFEITPLTVKRPKRDAAKKAESQIKVLRAAEEAGDGDEVDTNGIEDDSKDDEEVQTCHTCKKVKPCEINILSYGHTEYFCDESCFAIFRDGPPVKPGESTEIVPSSTVIKEIRSADIQPISRAAFIRKCSHCSSVIKEDNEKTLSWETMDFCSEECLGKYQQELGSHCANCKGNVQPASLGKYCVRFGYEVKQFCCSTCLEEFKKGLKVCSFCQKDISSGAEGFLAPVGDKGTFKDFCTQACMEKYEQMSSNQPPPPQTQLCHVCNTMKLVEMEVFFENKVNKLCSDICFSAYKFANNLVVDRCDMCKKYFDKEANGEKFNIFYEGIPHNFCCKTCMNVYILAKRKIVPCNWCKVKKYNFDMIKRILNTGQVLMMCSLNCMTLYQVSINAVSSRRIKCDMCMSVAQAQYHLTMSDATIRNFCTYPCVMNFQQQYSKSPITLPGSNDPPIPTGGPVPVISSVTSLTNGQITSKDSSIKPPSGKLNLVARLQEPPICRNKITQTRPIMNTKSVSCRPHSVSVFTQTDDAVGKPVLIPIPVPIYVPCPMAMYSFPYPVPTPFPLPIPVPIFLPTTRNSIKGIMKEIKRIQEKVPADPLEAELLMMAEMVAADKKEVVTSSDSEPDNDNEPAADSRPNSDGEEFNSETIETNNTFGEDIMQMALKMATELGEPDLETQLTPATILNQSQTENSEDKTNNAETTKKTSPGEKRGRKRSITKSPQKRNKSSDTKRKKVNNSSEVTTTTPPVVVEEAPKPDANMKLKYTFGVNAWKSWVTQKNAEIEKLSSTNKKLKPLKTDILQLTVDELNFSLSMFVKEVQKPNGTQYAPDTIYYLCLGIQQYLYENGRIDNIFTDAYFESFTDSLDEIAKKFTEIFNDHHYIVTRVEEEHLWESKQLGAHSPHVLLSTLLFFNTKHFNLTNVDEHFMLSFSHIMKHWKRNLNQSSTGGGGKAPGSRNVLLRFYPPQSVLDDPLSKKKKVYEQLENEENPLRCPVKLYEFYLSKCPESVKTRSDVFYLQPERSCVPDSPVWYSTMALSREPLEKMLNRVKMVKEINVALLVP